MLNRFYAVLFIVVVCLNSFTFAQSVSESDKLKITEAETQEAQDLAKKFTERFLETKDLAPLLSEFYFSDFIDRYKKFQSQKDRQSAKNLFVSGLLFDSKVIAEGSSEEWKRFYISAHNFVLLPLVAMLKNAKDNPGREDDFDVVKFYSPSVVDLLNKNPNLADVIQKKGDYKPVATAEELRNATATLEKALAITRKKQSNSLVLKIDDKKLTKIFEEDYFKPEIEFADDGEYNFPKDTHFIFIKTPIFMQLMLARDKDKLKIVYATLNYD